MIYSFSTWLMLIFIHTHDAPFFFFFFLYICTHVLLFNPPPSPTHSRFCLFEFKSRVNPVPSKLTYTSTDPAPLHDDPRRKAWSFLISRFFLSYWFLRRVWLRAFEGTDSDVPNGIRADDHDWISFLKVEGEGRSSWLESRSMLALGLVIYVPVHILLVSIFYLTHTS